MEQQEFVELALVRCVKQLRKSERGRDVLADLRVFLNGRICGLDNEGWEAVVVLMQAHHSGWTATVLNALEEV